MHLRPAFLLFVTSLPLLAEALPQHVAAARAVANTTLQSTSVFLISYTVYTTVVETSDAAPSPTSTQITESGNPGGAPNTVVPNISTGITLPASDSTPVIPSTIASDAPQDLSLTDSLTSTEPIAPFNTDTTTTNVDAASALLPSTSIPLDSPSPPSTPTPISYTFLNSTDTSTPSLSISSFPFSSNTTSTTDPPLPTASLNAQCHDNPSAAICLGPPGNRFYCCDASNPRCNPILVDGGFDCDGKTLGALAATWIRPTVTLVLQ